MPEPVLHVRRVHAFVHEMHRDAVPEHVHVASPLGEVRRRRVPPKQVVDEGWRDRGARASRALKEETCGTGVAGRQVGP